MKKTLSLLIIFSMVLSLFACKPGKENQGGEGEGNQGGELEVSYSFTESGEKTIEMPELPRDTGAFGELTIDFIDPESLLDLEKSIGYTNNTLTFHINQNPCFC